MTRPKYIVIVRDSADPKKATFEECDTEKEAFEVRQRMIEEHNISPDNIHVFCDRHRYGMYIVHIAGLGYYDGRNEKYCDLIDITAAQFARRYPTVGAAQKAIASLANAGYQCDIQRYDPLSGTGDPRIL